MLLAAAAAVSFVQAESPARPVSASAVLPKGYFTQNVGQWADHVLYHGSFAQYDVSVTRDAVVVHHYRLEGSREEPEAQIASLSMQVGSGEFGKVRPLHRDSVWYNFNGTSLARFGELLIETSVPGIDLALRAEDGQLRYDFHLAPGVSPDALDVAYEGDAGKRVTRDAIVFDTELGQVRHADLVSYQTKGRALASRFVERGDGSIGFQVDGVDPTKPLVIDPVVYGTFFGGLGNDDPAAIAVGAGGDVYVAGSTFSFGFNPFGVVHTAQMGFVAWFEPDNKLKSVFINAGQHAIAFNDVTELPDGAVAVVGQTANTSLFNYGEISVPNGQTMGLVARLIRSEIGLLMTRGGLFGGAGATFANSVTPFFSSSVAIVGSTASTSSWTPAASTGAQGPLGNSDGYLLMIDIPESGPWGVTTRFFIGGTQFDELSACAFHPNFPGIILVAGTTAAAGGLTTTGGFFDQTAAGNEGLVGMINTNLFPLGMDIGFVGGNGNDVIYDLALNGAGVVAVVGATQNTSGFPFVNPLQNSTSASSAGFLVYGMGIRSPMVSTWLGGNAGVQPISVDLDDRGHVHILGHAGTGFATTLGAAQTDFGGSLDAFYTRFGYQQVPGLTVEAPDFYYATYLGGPGNEFVGDVKTRNGEALVTLSSTGGVPTSHDGQVRNPVGLADGFLASIRPSVTDFPVVSNLPPGGSGVGFAGITGPLPFDVTIQLASSSSKLKLPETVVVRAGQTQSPFMMSTQDVLSTETVTVSAFWEGQLRQSFMDIAAPAFGGVINLDGANGPLRPTTVALEFREAGHPDVLITKVVAVAPDGTFLTDAPSNRVFDVSVKPGHWLRRTVRFDTRPGAISGAAISLLNGDCNGDNTVSIADFLLLRQAFGASAGDPRFNPNADLNRDGSIGIGDFLLLRRNFGRSGDQ